jgi:hypothetical protein
MRCASSSSTGLVRGGLERTHQPLPVVKTVASDGCTGWPVWTKGQCIAQQCISRGAELPTEIPPRVSGAWSVNTTPCSGQPIAGGRAVIGEGANDLAIVVYR